MTLLYGVLLYVVLARVAELVFAARNTRRLRAAGAQEVGAGHYPLIVALHVCWLGSLAILIPAEQVPDWSLLSLFVLCQFLRLWVLVTLGRYWTTRIITLPSAPLVAHGPYRFLRHPNYLVVVLEIALLPLAFGAWEIALVFSLLNAALLAWRISVEERALSGRRDAKSC